MTGTGNFPHTNIPMPQGPLPSVPQTPQVAEAAEKKFNDELAPGGEEDMVQHQPKESTQDPSKPAEDNNEASESTNGETNNTSSIPAVDGEPQPRDSVDANGSFPNDMAVDNDGPAFPGGIDGPAFHQQLDQGIPMSMNGHMNMPMMPPNGHGPPHMNMNINMPMHGFRHHGHGHTPMFNGPPQGTGQGVEGAPAAPRAMRQGMPNTGIRHHRAYSSFGGRAPESKGTRRYVLSPLIVAMLLTSDFQSIPREAILQRRWRTQR